MEDTLSTTIIIAETADEAVVMETLNTLSSTHETVPADSTKTTKPITAGELMFEGMLGIFVFMVIFYLVVKLLDKLFKVDPEEGVN